MNSGKLGALGRKFLPASVVGTVLAWSAMAFATSITPNAAITAVGVQANTAYFHFATMPPECVANSFSNYYIDPSKVGGEAAASRILSGVTAAYLSGRLVKRVDYTQTGTGGCFVSLIEF